MPHFRRLGIRAYRSIEKCDLKLGEITVVIGPSDTGKSNLIRALRDWSFNATGDKFITKGKGRCRIAVAVGPRYKVLWEKLGGRLGRSARGGEGSRTRYVVSDAEGETHSFEKIGHTVPEEVSAITGVRELDIDRDLQVRPNLAEQADPWFLLQSPPWTPGKTTKVIGRVSGIDALILANRDVVNDRTAAQREAKWAREAADERRASLTTFEDLEETKRLTERAARKLARLQKTEKRFEKAKDLLRTIISERKRLAGIKSAVEIQREAVDAAEKLQLVENMDRLRKATKAYELATTLEAKHGELEVQRVKTGCRLHDLAVELKEAAEQETPCPLCGDSMHAECAARLREQAESALRDS